MPIAWPRFWVDHIQGFNYILVYKLGDEQFEMKLTRLVAMAREAKLGPFISRGVRLRMVDRSSRRHWVYD